MEPAGADFFRLNICLFSAGAKFVRFDICLFSGRELMASAQLFGRRRFWHTSYIYWLLSRTSYGLSTWILSAIQFWKDSGQRLPGRQPFAQVDDAVSSFCLTRSLRRYKYKTAMIPAVCCEAREYFNNWLGGLKPEASFEPSENFELSTWFVPASQLLDNIGSAWLVYYGTLMMCVCFRRSMVYELST